MRPDVFHFFRERWRGKTPLPRLFWIDLLATATVLNLLFGFVSLLMLAKRVDWAWVFAVHALVIPYNAFLVVSIWRHVETPPWMRAASAVWLLVAFAI